MPTVVSFFASPFLGECANAFGCRRKAIRCRTAAFTITRETDRDGEERLNVDASTSSAKGTQVRLTLWGNGDLWFRAAQPGPSRHGGWRFLLVFDGDASTLNPSELVELFEESLLELHGQVEQESAERLLRVWERAGPQIAG